MTAIAFLAAAWAAVLSATFFSGCSGGTAEPVAAAGPTAEAILRRVIETYRSAESYSDRGCVVLKYRSGQQQVEDAGRLSVKFQRPGSLQLRAYQLTMICRDGLSQAVIADEATRDMDGQVAVREVPMPLDLESIYKDPVAKAVVASGMGGPPVTLELLLGANPLANLFEPQVARRLLTPEKIGERTCDRVLVELPEGSLVFWIDRRQHLLLRLEYPAAQLAEQIAAGDRAEHPGAPSPRPPEDVSLTAEFRDARLDTSIPADEFTFYPAEGAKRVAEFVVPPQPPDSSLLGQVPDDYFFTDLNEEDVPRERLLGEVTVLTWFNDHPASQSALLALQAARPRWDGERVAFHAVCTEPSLLTNAALRELAGRWQIELPIVRDLEAFGRDVFRIPWAPTTVVLDRRGAVQHFEVGDSPQLAERIEAIVLRLLAGDDVAGDGLRLYERARLEYEAALAAAASQVPPASLPR